jgi:16S rRNA C967 or C1407 C5-methylase (RsmB/RsmF family)
MGKKRKSKQYTFIPERFLERLTEMFGVSLSNQIGQTFVKRPITFRVNSIKSTKQEIRKILLGGGFKVRDVLWYKDAFILQNKWKQDIMDLDIYKTGKIYMQSLASMVPSLVLNPQPGEKVLDLTAAPGSKTSQIAALMDRKGELVANDNNKIRFSKLKHNMELLGVDSSEDDFLKLRMEHGVVLSKEYPEYFDKILLDTPCSAETRFLTDKPKSFSYWNERKIKEMAHKQFGLLRSAWGALKSGGILVYSTCTFAPEENELQVSKFMEYNPDCTILPVELSGIKKLPIVKNFKDKEVRKDVIKNAFRIMPDKEIEGFFVVKLKKSS